MNAPAILFSCPAYQVIEGRKDAQTGAVILRHGTSCAIDSGRGYWKRFKAGTVASYAIANDECPIYAHARAQARGYDTHYLFPLATVISAHAREPETLIGLTLGMLVSLEGQLFRVARGSNADNLNLTPEDV